MDSAVGLVQTYLRVNGYFTVSEYPIVEFKRDFQTATDLDILAFRFPRTERLIPGESSAGQSRHPHFSVDPRLGIAAEQPDMIVGEVKEGAAEFNLGGRRRDVLAAALARFGCCAIADADAVVGELARSGRAETPAGHTVRLVAFGVVGAGATGQPYLRISLGHVVRYLEDWMAAHWEVLRHVQSKDPVLGFLATLAKARKGKGTSGADGGRHEIRDENGRGGRATNARHRSGDARKHSGRSPTRRER